MKKIGKIFTLIGVLLVIVGSIIFIKALGDNNWSFESLNSSRLVETTFDFNDDINDILIDSDTSDIKISKSNDGINKVVCKGPEKLIHQVTLENRTLKIITHNTSKWYENLFTIGNYSITLYLVDTEFNSLTIDESTGDINILEGFTFNSMDIEASTGDLKISSCKINSLDIDLSTGDVTLKNIASNNIDIEVSTGTVEGEELDCKENLFIKVSTGKTTLNNSKSKNFTSSGSTGDLYINNYIVEEKINIKRNTGDVIFVKMDAQEICIKTSTGRVSGTLCSDKIFFIETNTGKKVYPQTTSGGKCEITTDTGDIVIQIEK